MGETPAAIAAWRRAAEVYEEIGSPRAVAIRADIHASSAP
jgi:hypothetical protein